MRRITAFIVAGAVLLFLICTIFSQPNRNGGSAKITVTFTGYTNEVTGGRLANFRISNLGGSGVFRWPDYTVEERGRVNPLNRGSYGAGGVLNPGSSSTCLLPAPSNSAPWRAVFTFSDNNWRRKLAGLPWGHGLLPAGFRSLPVQEGISDWVGDISTVGAAPYRERMATIVVRSSPKLQQQTNAPAQAPTTNAVNPPIGASQ